MSVWFYSHTCLTGDIVVPELTQFLLTLTHWITKYQKSCDYPYWSGWKPSMYGDLRVDTIFPKVWFSFDSPLSLTSSPVSHVGKWQSPASPEHWAVQFHSLSRSVSFSGLDKCSSFVISFFKYQCFMEEKVSVSAITVPVRRMILSSIHCRADPLSACLCSERWGVCFRIKALHRDVHTDARGLGLSRCQILLTASQDKAHWCVGSVLVNIKSGEAASVSVLQNQFLWDVAVTHRQPQQSNGWGSRITSSRPAWAPSFKPDFKCRWGPVSKTPKQASNSFDLQAPESTSGFWATR